MLTKLAYFFLFFLMVLLLYCYFGPAACAIYIKQFKFFCTYNKGKFECKYIFKVDLKISSTIWASSVRFYATFCTTNLVLENGEAKRWNIMKCTLYIFLKDANAHMSMK